MLNIAPKTIISIAFVVVSLIVYYNINLAMQTPALGIQWQSNEHNEVYISEVFDHSPAERAHVPSGKIIVAIGAASLSEPLSAITITEEPDNLVAYEKADAFFKHQSRIFNILQYNQVWLEDKSGQRYMLTPEPRKITWLPNIYWFQIMCGLLSFIAGLIVLAFRTQDTASQVYAFNGFSFSLVTFSAAIYSGRELAISGDLFHILSSLNHLGALWFAATFVALAWHVPKTLHRFSIGKTLVALFTLFWIMDTLRFETESPELWVQLPILFGLLASITIAIIQWRKCKQRPDDKQALRWLLLSLLIPGIIFLSLTIVLQWLGIELIIPQGYAFGILLVMYLGISLGVIRYALFELQHWWSSIWLWLFSGIAFVGIDIGLATFLHWNELLSTLISLVIIGFIYMPLRHRILSKISSVQSISLEDLIPQVLKLVAYANKPAKLEQQWHSLLTHAFSPLSTHVNHNIHHTEPKILEHGLVLYVPDIGTGSSFLLEYPDQGSRLFSETDAVSVSSLIQMVQKALNDFQTYNKGIAKERQRIAEDLHDDLGAKLLSLVYKSETPEQKELAHQAMGVLREVISSGQDEQVLLINQALSWKTEAVQRASETQKVLIWRQYGISPSQKISANINIQLSKVLREALSNALKHGESNVTISLYLRNTQLYMSVRNHGASFCDKSVNRKGRSNMKRRIEHLNGKIRWRSGRNGGCHVAWVVPLDAQ